MQWLKAKTLSDLKACGSFQDVRREIKGSLEPCLTIKARSWKNLLSAIQKIQSLSSSQPYEESNLYFNSKASQLIYALVELDGEQRLRELGINRSHYREKEKAKEWRNEITKLIHPDVCGHPKASQASNKLAELYQNMTKK